jgi:hypothetical protein
VVKSPARLNSVVIYLHLCLRNLLPFFYLYSVLSAQVKKHSLLSNQDTKLIVPAIAQVLAWSQKYMRGRQVVLINFRRTNVHSFHFQDECSFVSLRDVERAMIIFTYFLDKMVILRSLIDCKEKVWILVLLSALFHQSLFPSGSSANSHSIFSYY